MVVAAFSIKGAVDIDDDGGSLHSSGILLGVMLCFLIDEARLLFVEVVLDCDIARRDSNICSEERVLPIAGALALCFRASDPPFFV